MYVIILREVGLHWDRASDLLAYALGMLIIVCILTLVFANAGGGVAEWGKEATGNFCFVMNVGVLVLAIWLVIARWSKKRVVPPGCTSRRSVRAHDDRAELFQNAHSNRGTSAKGRSAYATECALEVLAIRL